VHPVAVLLLDSLTTNLDLNILNELVSREVKPSGIDLAVIGKRFTNLWESNL
jgi:hypothetical protein